MNNLPLNECSYKKPADNSGGRTNLTHQPKLYAPHKRRDKKQYNQDVYDVHG